MNITYIMILAVLILLSAYFSATETAFSSLNKTRLKTFAEKGNRKAQLACKLHDNYDKLISTILIGNNIVNIAAASIGTIAFVKSFGDIGATISTVVITLLVLIFGEITPKSIAKDYPEKFAMFSAPLIRILIWILTPLNFIFTLWKKLVLKFFKPQNDSKMSQEELLMLVEEVQQEGSIDKNEGELLKNAIEFTEQEAGDILTHRMDLEAVSINASKEEIARVFAETRFSRILVYEESVDNIIGVIHQKDFYHGSGISGKNIRELISPVIFVMQNEKINTLLRRLQKNKTHVSVVIDEFGGTCGIVTMEDILEELVGEIWDEHDEVQETFKKVKQNVYLVDAAVSLDDFCEFFNVKIDSEMTALSGWVLEKIAHPVKLGDRIEYEGLTISVTATENLRIIEVEVVNGDGSH